MASLHTKACTTSVVTQQPHCDKRAKPYATSNTALVLYQLANIPINILRCSRGPKTVQTSSRTPPGQHDSSKRHARKTACQHDTTHRDHQQPPSARIPLTLRQTTALLPERPATRQHSSKSGDAPPVSPRTPTFPGRVPPLRSKTPQRAHGNWLLRVLSFWPARRPLKTC